MAKRPADTESPAPYERFSWFHSFFGPPLLPSAEDISWCWEIAGGWVRQRGAPRVLVLGVTPEFYGLPWPQGTDLLVVDLSQTMLDNTWPGPRETALCANWLSMDLPQSSRDLALCDGGLPLLDYPGQYELVRILRRVLADEGLCILRTFVLPPEQETPELVIRDFIEGKIRDLSALVLRMNMALHRPGEGVVFGKVYRTIGAVPDLTQVLADLGWTAEHSKLIDLCKGVESGWRLLTLEQTVDLFCRDPGGFQVHAQYAAPGDLGRLCPTLAFRRC